MNEITNFDFQVIAFNKYDYLSFLNLIKTELSKSTLLNFINLPSRHLVNLFLLPLEMKIKINVESVVVEYIHENEIIDFENIITDNITEIEDLTKLIKTKKINGKSYYPIISSPQFYYFFPVFDFYYYSKFDELFQPIMVINEKGKVLYSNQFASELFDLPLKRIKKKLININDRIIFNEKKFFFNSEETCGLEQPSLYQEMKYSLKNGSEGIIQLNITPDKNFSGSEKKWIIYFQPVSIEVALQEKYQQKVDEKKVVLDQLGEKEVEVQNFSKLAYTDQMTQIPNYRALIEKLTNDLKNTKLTRNNLALIMIDLDFFKKVNDEYGHKQGDLVLQELAKHVSGQLRGGDMVARYGGEEFSIILNNVKEISSMQIFSDRLLNSIRDLEIKNLKDPKHMMKITASFGGIFITHDEIPAIIDDEFINRLFELADNYLYTSKANGRNCYTISNLQDAIKLNNQPKEKSKIVYIENKNNCHDTIGIPKAKLEERIDKLFKKNNLSVEKTAILFNYEKDEYNDFLIENSPDLAINFSNIRPFEILDKVENFLTNDDKLLNFQVIKNKSDFQKIEEQILGEFDNYKYSNFLKENFQLIFNELYTNAFYNAPTDQTGTFLYKDSNRQEDINFAGEVAPFVEYHINDDHIVFQITDRFGSITKDVLEKYLFQKTYDHDASIRKKGGAGLGLSLLLKTSETLFIKVKKNKYTKFQFTISKTSKNKDFLNANRALLYFFKEDK